jgi:putative ABC transport system ATP-binding protein
MAHGLNYDRQRSTAVSRIIDCESVTKRYSDQPAVLDALDLSVDAGEFVAILGRSGSGKSTLLKLLGAMESATSGSVVVAGQNLCHLDDAGHTQFRRRAIGFVFQSYNLLPTLNVGDNLRLPLTLNDLADDGRVHRQLQVLGLEHVEARYPNTLSGGEQQRVAIGRALIHAPSLILADEPTGNLDHATSDQVLTLLRTLIRASRATVVMATHSLEAARVADTVYTLDGGRLIAQR